MPNGLELTQRRVERAKEQRRDIEREMRSWSESGAYKISSQPEPKTGRTLYYVAELKPVPPLVLDLAGEIIHSLRSALDHLAYQLLLVSSHSPHNFSDKIEFPIYDDSKKTKADAFRPIKPLRPEIVKAISRINPCKTGNSVLWVLHRLDIINKHRRLITSFLAHHSVYFGDAAREFLRRRGMADMVDVMTPYIEKRSADLFASSPRTGKRAQVGDIVFVGMPGDEEVNKHLKFTFNVAFDEPGIIDGKPIIETIDETINVVENLILGFAPFLV